MIPSGRVVEGLGLSEAEVARSVLERIAGGSSTVAEARRLNDLGVPTRRRYAGGAEVTVGEDWKPSRINQMVKNPVYAGTHVLKSRGGAVERAVPALVDRATWERAQAQLGRNRAISTRNAKRTYLLRGLVRCAGCGARFVGTPKSGRSGWRDHYYRCGSQPAAAGPEPEGRCGAKILHAERLESLVWADCRAFVLEPGPALAKARTQLRERLSHSAELDGERRRLQARLADKEAERERVMTLYRRGRASLEDAEAQLDAIQSEAGVLRAALDALRTQEELSRAFEAHYADAAALLVRLRDRVAEIDAADDRETKRQVIEMLVSDVVVTTRGEGRNKVAEVTITYAFSGHRVVDPTTSRRGRSRGTG